MFAKIANKMVYTERLQKNLNNLIAFHELRDLNWKHIKEIDMKRSYLLNNYVTEVSY